LLSFGHCIVCLSSIYAFWLPLLIYAFWLPLLIYAFWLPVLIYSFWLPLCYLLAIVLSVFLRFTPSDCPFAIFWPLYCLSFFDLRLLIAPLLSFGHCIVCLSTIYAFWLPLLIYAFCLPLLIYAFWLPLLIYL
jgi:hypothetical protein